MFILSLCICFILSLAPFSIATEGLDELIIDQSCKNFGSLGDVSSDLNKAYEDARTLAADAHQRVDSLRKTLAGTANLLADGEILRLERLLAAFFIGPFKDASSPPLGRKPDNEGYEETSSDLEANLGVMNVFGVSTMPPMFCGPPIISQEDAAGKTNAQKKGNFVKITTNADGSDVVDKNGKKSFYYQDYLVGVPNNGIVNTVPIGQDPCLDGALAATNAERWMLWCPQTFSSIRKVLVPTDPKASENQKTDFSSLSYRFSDKRKISYWRNSIAVTMLHEMHHVYIEGSTDITVKISYPSQKEEKAYGYGGTVQLAENVRVSGNWAQLSQNADSMAIFAVAAYLEGCDWSMWTAKKLSQITNTVKPPPSNTPSRKMMLAKRRIERRYAEKRRAEKRARAAGRFGVDMALALPMSPAGREI